MRLDLQCCRQSAGFSQENRSQNTVIHLWQIHFLDKGYDEHETILDQLFGKVQRDSNLYFFLTALVDFCSVYVLSNRNAAPPQTRKIYNNYTV